MSIYLANCFGIEKTIQIKWFVFLELFRDFISKEMEFGNTTKCDRRLKKSKNETVNHNKGMVVCG